MVGPQTRGDGTMRRRIGGMAEGRDLDGSLPSLTLYLLFTLTLYLTLRVGQFTDWTS